MENCIFCKIVRKEIPSEIVFEDDKSIAFLDINPVNDGHTLIIPKEHYEKMTDTPDELLVRLFIRAKQLIPLIQKATNASFIVEMVYGIDVPHFHIHLIPRYNNDGLHLWRGHPYDHPEKMREIAKKMRGLV